MEVYWFFSHDGQLWWSLIQDWNTPQLAAPPTTAALSTSLAVSSTVNSLDSLSEAMLWPSSSSSDSVDVAPQTNLIRQPSPPPVAAPVQTLQAALDTLDYPQPQLLPADVADPRPGVAQALDNDISKGPKHLHLVCDMIMVTHLLMTIIFDILPPSWCFSL